MRVSRAIIHGAVQLKISLIHQLNSLAPAKKQKKVIAAASRSI